jgi:hypothetical protein
MSKLKFSDGEVFDVSGILRVEERKDGWYVIGGGMLVPVDDKEDGERYIKRLNVIGQNIDSIFNL